MISHYLTHLLTGKGGCEDYNSVLGSELNASMYNWHYNKSEVTGNQRMTKKKKKRHGFISESGILILCEKISISSPI